MKHLIVIPYYCRQEVRRFLWTADHIKRMPRAKVPFEFLISSRFDAKADDRLFDVLSAIAPTKMFRCTTQQKGNPPGSKAMFFDTMNHIALHYESDGGFALWFESDMVPIKHDWLSRISREWTDVPQNKAVMGHGIAPIKQAGIPGHINGGACYAKNLARLVRLDKIVDQHVVQKAFDMLLFQEIQRVQPYKYSKAFVNAYLSFIPRYFNDSQICVLHGWAQPKDKFVKECINYSRSSEKSKCIKHIFYTMRIKLKLYRCCLLSRYLKDIDAECSTCPVHGAFIPFIVLSEYRRFFYVIAKYLVKRCFPALFKFIKRSKTTNNCLNKIE